MVDRNALYRQSQQRTADQFDRPSVYDQPVKHRMGLLPFAEYEGGKVGLAWPGMVESAANALTAPARAYRGEIAPDDMVGEGMNVAGMATMSGFAAPKPGGVAAASSPKIRAYHVSPNDFTAFDASKIGQGIGVNTEGRGHYLSTSKDLVNAYADDMRLEGKNPVKYEVDINADPKSFLNWDKLDRNTQKHFSTEDGRTSGIKNGIPGVVADNTLGKYRGTQNYTVFDPAKLEIVNKGTDIYSNAKQSTLPGVMMQEAAKEHPGITAYHGSPHDFDEFKAPAFFYRDRGSANEYKHMGGGGDNLNSIYKHPSIPSDPEGKGYHFASKAVDAAGGDRELATRNLLAEADKFRAQETPGRSWIDRMFGRSDPEISAIKSRISDRYQGAAEWLQNGGSHGRLYEVKIPEPTHYIKDYAGSQADALNKAKAQGHSVVGIHGDEIAVLDDNLISILKKYGLMGMLGGGAAAGIGGQKAEAAPTNALMRR